MKKILGNCLKGIQYAGGALGRILQVVPMNADKERNKEKQGSVFRLNQQKDQ